jgi:lipoprotein-anchoring transpeptidase ErfK/SrfK
MNLKRRAMLSVMILAVVSLVVAGCKPAGKQARPPAQPKLVITPAANAANVPISAEIGATVADGKITGIALLDDKGQKVAGAMRRDGSTWLPGEPLKNKQSYTAQVTAANDSGKTVTETSRFTTMDKPAKQTQTTLYFNNDRTYGVAMPVTVAFEPAVPKEARADVQRRLFVETDPPQPGAWHWVESGTQAYYRAPDFWQPGTKISIRSALGGLPIGKDSYGDADHVASAKIGNKVSLEIDNATKQMSVFKDDTLVRKIPVSLGKASTPSSSGKMVIMEKFGSTVFDTTGSPDPYVVTVQDAQRLTWGGEFIHSAPWSVGDQGYANVTHGCTNVSPQDAAWLMNTTQVGDLVTVKGTEVKLEHGNGWTAWDLSWDEFVKGSALPVPSDLKPGSKPSPSNGGSSSPSNSPSPSSSPTPAPSNRGG